ncbi:MAG: beta-hydroxyacyl-ACP dehydratase [Thermodesulfobacteriota bacterium]
MAQKINTIYQSLPACCKEWRNSSQDSESLALSARFNFPDSFPGFEGHFPGQPVLPAIIQLGAVRYLAQCALDTPLSPVAYGRTKFRGMISPREEIEIAVDLALEAEQGQWVGRFAIKRGDQELVANGSCTFAAAKG